MWEIWIEEFHLLFLYFCVEVTKQNNLGHWGHPLVWATGKAPVCQCKKTKIKSVHAQTHDASSLSVMIMSQNAKSTWDACICDQEKMTGIDIESPYATKHHKHTDYTKHERWTRPWHWLNTGLLEMTRQWCDHWDAQERKVKDDQRHTHDMQSQTHSLAMEKKQAWAKVQWTMTA